MTNSASFKILGQTPAFAVSVVEAFLAILLSFGLFHLTQDTVGVIVAAVTAVLGLVTAYATKTTVYSALVSAAKALLVLAVTFGAPLTDSESASLIALVVLVGGAYLHNTTSSVDSAVSSASPGSLAA